MEHVENIADKLGLRRFVHIEFIQTAATKSNLPPIIVTFAVFVLGVLAVLLLEYPRIIFEVVFLFIYPAYKSFKALQTEGSYDDRRWLTYWIIFGLLFGFETSIGFLLRLIPLWPSVRIGFLVYILIPSTHGAELVYDKVISPVFIKYSQQIDGVLESTEAKMKDLKQKAKEHASQTITNNLLKTSGN